MASQLYSGPAAGLLLHVEHVLQHMSCVCCNCLSATLHYNSLALHAKARYDDVVHRQCDHFTQLQLLNQSTEARHAQR